jgi:hypothetical protein
MPKRPSPTLQVLREIRDGIQQTNERLGRVEGRVEALERRQSESEARLATELIAVGKAVGEVRDNLVVQHRVEDHQRRILALERQFRNVAEPSARAARTQRRRVPRKSAHDERRTRSRRSWMFVTRSAARPRHSCAS